jgi:hypothetical protein
MKIELPTHPTVQAMAETCFDHDEMLASLKRHMKNMPAEQRLPPEHLEKLHRDFNPFVQMAFAKGAAAERMRIVRWFNEMATEEFRKGHNIRGQAFAQLAIQLMDSMTGG